MVALSGTADIQSKGKNDDVMPVQPSSSSSLWSKIMQWFGSTEPQPKPTTADETHEPLKEVDTQPTESRVPLDDDHFATENDDSDEVID